MNVIDQTLQRSFPSVMVPRREPLQPMQGLGERLLIASSGIFLEIVRPWIRVVRQIAAYEVATAIPYGEVEEMTQLPCGKVPEDLIVEFARLARAVSPKETGAWIVWNAESHAFRMAPVKVLSHSAGHLQYERPSLDKEEMLIVDCHSHGEAGAFFSRTDNADDRHDVKFSVVLGHCDGDRPSIALRLCAKGIFERMEIPSTWAQAIHAREAV
jgi:PRTRC genetic system protein A